MNSHEADKYSTIGILGGMGPDATVACYQSIIDQTPAQTDQQHLPAVIVSNPQIPDRTEAILHQGENPVPCLAESALRLEKAGADFIIMPCNTAHYFIEEVRERVALPILNMVQAAVRQRSNSAALGLLATTGTIKTGIYEKTSDVKIITPTEELQKKVMEVIYGKEGIKAGFKNDTHKRKLELVARSLKKRGAEGIISGCTELRLVLKENKLAGVPLVFPIDVIARKAIEKAKAKAS